jgi:branched-chain amino acid transport system substrate-binding protein
VNAAGGIMGRQVQLIFEDEEANPSVAVQKAEKLFEVQKVDFLTGTVNSGSTLAVGQTAEQAGKLIATTVSFADSITGDKCSPNVFRVNAKAGQQSTALAAWVAKQKPKAKVFFLGPDYEMGRSTVATFKKTIEGLGAVSTGEVFAPLDVRITRSTSVSYARQSLKCFIHRSRVTIPSVCSRRCRILAFWVIFSSLAHPAQ